MWELDCEESWVLKNWCFSTVVLEKTLESPLDCKKIQPVHPKGHQSLGVHWKDWCWSCNSQYSGHLMWRAESLENTLMLGKIDGRRRRGWQRMRCLDGIDGHEFEWTPGVGDGQGGLACYGSWGRKESGTTDWLKWTEQKMLKDKYIHQKFHNQKFLLSEIKAKWWYSAE